MVHRALVAPLRVALAALLALFVGFAQPAFAQADAERVLRVSFPIAETGFDPQAAGDIYSNYVNRAIFDPLYRYDYLARPYRIVPNTAAALPEISADGKTYTIKVRPGIWFADDPAFKGQRRELTAADYVYAIKRVLDPRMRSNSVIVVDGRFVGADAVVEKARETGRFDYDAPIEGLQAVDRYTLRFRLNFPDTELMSNLTTTALAAVAREVVEAYADGSGWVMANPVGTGPYRLKDWRRGQRIVLEANPGYRDERYPVPSDPADRAIARNLAGRKLPLVPRVEISIIEEGNPRLLAFRQGALDYLGVPSDLVANVLDANNRLRPDFARDGVRLQRDVQPAISYLYFNMDDAVVGGYTPERIALRRAIALSYNVDEHIRVIQQGQGTPATQIVPPNMSGHDSTLDGRRTFDLAGARALLDKFGYKDRDGDGFREGPDGKPLVLKMYSTPSAADRELDDLWQRSLVAAGLRTEFSKQKWPDLLKAARLGQLQSWRLGNINTTPDGFVFLGLLYGPHAGFANLARFRLPEYDRLYEQARSLPDGAARTRAIRRMTDLFNAYTPWVLISFRYENVIAQPWLVGYKYNPTYQHPWPYLDIDAGARAKARR
jgi:ABC-type transport system substrate-binding protein